MCDECPYQLMEVSDHPLLKLYTFKIKCADGDLLASFPVFIGSQASYYFEEAAKYKSMKHMSFGGIELCSLEKDEAAKLILLYRGQIHPLH